jgi:hypothetical protein
MWLAVTIALSPGVVTAVEIPNRGNWAVAVERILHGSPCENSRVGRVPPQLGFHGKVLGKSRNALDRNLNKNREMFN